MAGRLLLLVLAFCVSFAGLARAQDPDSEENDPAARLRALEEWIVLEDESAPEPPLLRFELGVLGVLEARSRIRADRGNVRGTPLEDLEGEQGLESGGIGPWLEFSLGGKVRGGGDALQFVRRSQFVRQSEAVDFDGVRLAEPGDLLRARFEFASIGGFVEWDLLYGRTYRIGLVGGLRYFRLDFDLEGVRLTQRPFKRTRRVSGELLSPFFGGIVELTPFPLFSVFTQAQFMNWSWERSGREEARDFQFRLGARVNLIPDVFAIGVEYRFLILRAEPSGRRTGGRRVDGALTANGLTFLVSFSF